MLSWSQYQLALFKAIETTDSSIVFEAVAGASKTTSIVHGAKLLPITSSILFLAFNVAIVKELQERLPSHVTCQTLNSLGYRSWRAYAGKKFLKVDANKTRNILRDALSNEDFQIYASFVERLVALGKSVGIGGILLENTPANWEELREHHNITINVPKSMEDYEPDYERGLLLCQKALARSIDMANVLVDFDDQIYMPYLKGARFDQYDVVFIDELQDVSPVQRNLLKRVIKKGGRIIGVGDSNQSIYAFRGADHNSMGDFAKEFSAAKLPLSISYRCAKAIVAEAKKYVPEIEPFESAPEGKVERLNEYMATTFLPTDIILCRNTAPLVKMSYGLISRGVAVSMSGRDFAKGLQKLVLDMKAPTLVELSEKLELWLERQSDLLIAKKQENKIEFLRDRVATLDIIIANLSMEKAGDNQVKALLEEIDFIFQSKAGAVSLMTVHRAKGTEADRVFILDSHLMPSKYALGRAWMEIQEKNLTYVAITRAKTYLAYIESDGFSDADEEIRQTNRANFIKTKMENPRPVAKPAKPAKPSKGGQIRIKLG